MKFRPIIARSAAVAAVLAPFLIAVAAHAVPDSLSEIAPAGQPALAFREYLLNFGRVPEGQPVKGQFWFVNNGDRPLEILGFEPSCGCLMPELDKRTYAPGEQGMFVVTADTAGESYNESTDPGNGDQPKQHFIGVRYRDGENERTARVHLKFVLPARRIIVEPRSLLVHQFGDGSGTGELTRTITVTDRRFPPANVLAVQSSNSPLLIETKLAEAADEPTRAVIDVTLPAEIAGTVTSRLVIRTDDPDQPLIKVPIVIQVHENHTGSNPLEFVPGKGALK